MKKFLIIDDDDIFNFLHREVINRLGNDNEVEEFSSSVEALDFIKNCVEKSITLPDYFFIDLRMPEMNGFELLDELMILPREAFKHVHIFVVTSSLDERDKQKVLEYPIVEGFKEKTINLDMLNEIVNKS
jgi:CheY-like chemotaxis protein